MILLDGFLLETFNFKTIQISIFVNKSLRRCRVGTNLINKAKEIAKLLGINKIIVSPYNKSNKLFFESVNL